MRVNIYIVIRKEKLLLKTGFEGRDTNLSDGDMKEYLQPYILTAVLLIIALKGTNNHKLVWQ